MIPLIDGLLAGVIDSQLPIRVVLQRKLKGWQNVMILFLYVSSKWQRRTFPPTCTPAANVFMYLRFPNCIKKRCCVNAQESMGYSLQFLGSMRNWQRSLMFMFHAKAQPRTLNGWGPTPRTDTGLILRCQVLVREELTSSFFRFSNFTSIPNQGRDRIKNIHCVSSPTKVFLWLWMSLIKTH